MSLRQALVAGGCAVETVNVLIESNLSSIAPRTSSNAAFTTVSSDMADTGGGSPCHPSDCMQISLSPLSKEFHPRHSTQFHPPAYSPVLKTESPSECEGKTAHVLQEKVPIHPETQHRTILLTGLPPSVNLQDLTKAIRGGQILQMSLRDGDKYARVSFVDPDAAEMFLLHSEQSGVFIKGQRVRVLWNDRQMNLTPHLANRTASGATRNLVIRHYKKYMTADSIRQDLDHIHNLQVVSIRYSGPHCFISLTSVQGACAARSCMHTRQKYKCVQIEFYPDECAQPLPEWRPKEYHLSKSPCIEVRNRFEVLLDDSEE
ncbi:hypothetical protein PV08_00407 [Exophiala spinifera]|uniref:RRM domain-containing protein n=1 Tax=Exophiala spinifera TaxID=91928 RepID=A0A0D2A4T1_9EURO|nr:uncharacterized protein PV08_00407 [Exophiala spinifera]KIW19832.1 hypothetical protein PV08_00407 [Exophiala spinifera]